MEPSSPKKPEKIKLVEINSYLTCYLCKGYLIDATTISECLHSFCRSCIIKFLQENSYCPVCEVIINKAKPNLKLDKTLQDIVYKLVPELFLKEMTRRKNFYQQFPDVAARLAPEERGEDTERTIFNPQDFISLSMEYIRDDSTPGAIRIPEAKSVLDKNKNETTMEENQEALMKRYLQCPGMCRVEVLKKFVRNKYNVDTNRFYIDVLYKRVPLPDHYTLIDIAYIYSWKRNEPMKFFFRITDINKVTERFDFFDGQTPVDFIPKFVRPTRQNGDKSNTPARRKEHTSSKKITNKTIKPPTSQDVNKKDKQQNSDASDSEQNNTARVNVETLADVNVGHNAIETDTKSEKINNKHDIYEYHEDTKDLPVCDKIFSKTVDLKTKNGEVTMNDKTNKSVCSKEPETLGKVDKSVTSTAASTTSTISDPKSDNSDAIIRKEITEQIKNKIQSDKGDNTKNSVYTNITLNRTNNVEIITKIQKVSNKDGQPIGLNIIKQTVKKSAKNKVTNNNTPQKIVVSGKAEIKNSTKDDKPEPVQAVEDEKSIFFKSIELTAKNNVPPQVQRPASPKLKEVVKAITGQKRKNPSPIKNDKDKKIKLDKKPTKIIITAKSPTVVPALANDSKQNLTNVAAIRTKPQNEKVTTTPNNKGDSELRSSLIDSCKINIPSSLSITLKESSDHSRSPITIPPVQNYIEILKLPDEPGDNKKSNNSTSMEKVEPENNLPIKTTISDFLKNEMQETSSNDSDRKVDQDLSEIAKSLTEKIPISTTVSQIVGPKNQFHIPSKPTPHIPVQPVPEIPCKALKIPKDPNLVKLNPRSPQTFQEIFEESIKKPDGTTTTITTVVKDGQKVALDLSCESVTNTSTSASTSSINTTTNGKRNILEIASKLHKKTKLILQEKKEVNDQKVSTSDCSNKANLHSNALGMNYTVSAEQPEQEGCKSNGVKAPVKIISVLSNSPTMVSPKNDQAEKAASNQPLDINTKLPEGNQIMVPTVDTSPPSLPQIMKKNLSPRISCSSPKHSPKSSPVVKHMYAPSMDQLKVYTYPQKITSPNLSSPKNVPKNSPKVSSNTPSPRQIQKSPNVKSSPTKLQNIAPKPASPSKAKNGSPSNAMVNGNAALTSNQLLEKYNIQNLAQLTASLNFNPVNFGMNPSNQLAAFQHAMFLKHIEMQNRQNWMNMNQGPLLQYEKYLQSLNSNQNHLLSNIKEN